MVKPRPVRLALALSPLLLALAAPSRSATSEWAVHPQVRARLLTARTVAAPGEPLLAGIEFALAPGWHAYWKNSGDAGFAPRVDFRSSEGLARSELRWPAPRRFQVRGGLQAFGYEHDVIYPVEIGIAAGAPRLALRAALDYVVCAEECVPYRDTLELAQPLGATPSGDPAAEPALVAAFSSVPTPVEQAHLVATATLTRPQPGRGELEIVLRGAQPALAGGADLFLESSDLFDAATPQIDTLPDALRFRVALTWKRADVAPPAVFTVAWVATGLAPPAPAAVSGRTRVAGGTAGGALSWLFVLPFIAVALVFLWLLRAARAHRTARPEE
ncbi:MAG: protein-disulfide reductase DsbD domain-containing protein [Acidobacteriota bacterium]